MLKCPGRREGERKGMGERERERTVIAVSCKPGPKGLFAEAGCCAEGLVR